MKVLFLDIDGVLNDHRWSLLSRPENDVAFILPRCVATFNKVLKALPDLKIVLTSAWRYMLLTNFESDKKYKQAMTLKGFEYMLRSHGVLCQDRIIGLTKTDEELSGLDKDSTRVLQIFNYLNTHKEITKFAVIDDQNLSIMNFIQTNSNAGISEQDKDKIINLLK